MDLMEDIDPEETRAILYNYRSYSEQLKLDKLAPSNGHLHYFKPSIALALAIASANEGRARAR
jgi:hypothetical protein